MKLTRKHVTEVPPPASGGALMDRRTFLTRSGVTAGSLAAAGSLPLGMMQKAVAAETAGEIKSAEMVRTVCTHCAVGCGIYAGVENGVWTRQEPAFDHPINRGAHCAKGAAVREHGHGERRLKYPTKLVDGKWTKVGTGRQRDRRPDVADPRTVRARFGVLAGFGQA